MGLHFCLKCLSLVRTDGQKSIRLDSASGSFKMPRINDTMNQYLQNIVPNRFVDSSSRISFSSAGSVGGKRKR